MERQTMWLCIGVALLVLAGVLLAVFLTRDHGLDGSGITFVQRWSGAYGRR